MTTKKALMVLGLLALLMTITLIIPAKWVGVQPVPKRPQLQITSSSLIEGGIKDEDNDNAISWKELIVGTIPPQDLPGEGSGKPKPEVIAALNDPNNLTASFGKNLYLAAAALQSQNISSEAGQQEVVSQLILEEASKIIPTVYTYNNLKIAPTENKDSIKEYGNSVAKILQDVITSKTIESDMKALENFINTTDESTLLPIIKNHEIIDGRLQKLLNLSIPISASAYHLLTINRLAAHKDVLFNLSRASQDPMRATVVIDKYPDTMLKVLRVYGEFATYFNLQNIVFSSKEAGYIFTIGYTFK